MTFDKKYVAVIIGACGGIGEAIARQLAMEGITLALIDKQADALQFLVTRLSHEYSQSITSFPVDVAEPQQVVSAFLAIRNQLGPIGYLVNSAGVLHHDSVENTDIDAWNRIFAINATGVFNVSKAAASYMTEQKKRQHRYCCFKCCTSTSGNDGSILCLKSGCSSFYICTWVGGGSIWNPVQCRRSRLNRYTNATQYVEK